MDDRLREEARRFGLAFTCDRCAHLDPTERKCSFGYPVEPHLDVSLDHAREVVFCKAFELS